jgi:xanthine/CO dehydrogenase XdhC/CoxF family maturation factor
VSILAEVVAARNRGSGASLREVGGPIHRAVAESVSADGIAR